MQKNFLCCAIRFSDILLYREFLLQLNYHIMHGYYIMSCHKAPQGKFDLSISCSCRERSHVWAARLTLLV